jgi:hypothetical protein
MPRRLDACFAFLGCLTVSSVVLAQTERSEATSPPPAAPSEAATGPDAAAPADASPPALESAAPAPAASTPVSKEPPPPPPPVIDVTAPPPAPVPKESRRIHQGLYVRASLGSGPMTTLFSDDLLERSRVTGSSGNFDLSMGGTPRPGLVVGGTLVYSGMESEDVVRWGTTAPRDSRPWIGVGAVGPFLDYFPDAKRGLHLGGMVGLSWMALYAPGFVQENERLAGGRAASLWVGNDWWVARDWSLGVNLRYLGVATRNSKYDWIGAADVFTISFTVLAQ